ncbi:hypothetical protein ACU4GD_16125 [Cupriavidus basilensis]
MRALLDDDPAAHAVPAALRWPGMIAAALDYRCRLAGAALNGTERNRTERPWISCSTAVRWLFCRQRHPGRRWLAPASRRPCRRAFNGQFVPRAAHAATSARRRRPHRPSCNPRDGRLTQHDPQYR